MTDDAILKPLITLIVPDRPRPRRPPDSLWAQVAKMEGGRGEIIYGLMHPSIQLASRAQRDLSIFLSRQ